MGQRCSSEHISPGITGTRGAPALHPAQQHHLSYTCVQEGTYLCIQAHLCALVSVHDPRGSKCPQDSVTQGQEAITEAGALPDTQQLCFDSPVKVRLS